LLELELVTEHVEDGEVRGVSLLDREAGFEIALRQREYCAGQPRLAGFDVFALRSPAREFVEAHDAGLTVTAHAHPLAAIRDAISAGVDGIEHCTFMTDAGMDFAPDVVAMLAERQIAVCPTLGSLGANPPLQLMEILRMSGLTQETRKQKIAALRDAGVRLVSGTDGGIKARISALRGCFRSGQDALRPRRLVPGERLPSGPN
jgi:imidazolonepropionase-like amidohydrolase